jgi:hypothetical protein
MFDFMLLCFSFLLVFATPSTQCFSAVVSKSQNVTRNVHACVGGDSISVSILTWLPLQTPYWRVRLVGSEIELMRILRDTNGTLFHGESMLCAGTYFLEVLLVYREFDEQNLIRNCVDAISVLAKPLALTVELQCQLRTKSGWLVKNTTSRADVLKLATTRVQRGGSLAYNWNDLIEYVALRGDPHFIVNKTVCLFGDSQMRHLFNELLRERGIECTAGATKNVCNDTSGLFHYAKLLWPNQTHIFAPQLMHNCSRLILNVGQWPAGWPGDFPFAVADYHRQVANLLSIVAQLEKPAFFLSTNPGPLGNLHIRCPAGDWRTDPVITAYNRAAAIVIEQLASPHLRFVDLYHIVAPVEDLSGDWCHFDGVVGKALAKSVMHLLA